MKILDIKTLDELQLATIALLKKLGVDDLTDSLTPANTEFEKTKYFPQLKNKIANLNGSDAQRKSLLINYLATIKYARNGARFE